MDLAFAMDPAQSIQFLVRLENLRKQCSASRWEDRVMGQLPAEVCCNLEAQSRGPLGIVRSQVDVNEAPGLLVSYLSTKPVHIIVVPLDTHDLRTIDAGS